MTNEASINILNGVLETLIDSSEGYEEAAKVADRETFKQFFTRRAGARRAMEASVRSEISNLGGAPAEDGTILAGAHRVFMKISAAVQDDDEAAIEAVDDGEEYLREKVEKALENEDLLPAGKTVLARFQGELKADGRLIDHLEDAA